MLRNILERCRLYDVMDYSAAVWGTTNLVKFTRSNANKTITSNASGSWSLAFTDLAITAPIYVEVTTKNFYASGVNSAVGIKLVTNAYSDADPTTTGGMYAFSDTTVAVYGISFNPTTGAFAIRKNNTQVHSGTLAANSNYRVSMWGGYYPEGVPTPATINTGNAAFTYPPVYV